MRPIHPVPDLAVRVKAVACGVLTAAICFAGASAFGQEFRLTESIERMPDAAVTQLLREMAQDAQARGPVVSTGQGVDSFWSTGAEGESLPTPTLVMLRGFYSVAPQPLQEDPAAPVPTVPVAVATPAAVPAPETVREPVAQPPDATPVPIAAIEPAPDIRPPIEAKTLPAAPPEPVSAPTANTVTQPAAASTATAPVMQKALPSAEASRVMPVKETAATTQGPPNNGRDGLPPLGIGDQITIAVFGQPDLSAEVTVGESGTIMVPLIGTLNVLNMSAAQLEAMVAMRLKDGGYLQNPGVSVQIRQLRSQLVSVIGEVQRPGRYPIQGRMTVLEALATAGGLTPRADKTIVLLRKPSADKAADTQREEISIQLETEGNGQFRGRLDAPLLNDDVVFVGVQKLFYIHGEVRRPGAYPMEPGLNIMKALSISGGVSERGSARRISIHRLNADKVLKELPAELAMPIQPDDVIHVDERLF
jgi:polysaccharide export outer membrane protein